MPQSYHEESISSSEDIAETPQTVNFFSICAIADSYEHSLTIDRILYEMTGDLECAAILSRLRYWFSPSKQNGQIRAKSRHDGKVWLYRKDDEWEEEACVRVKQMPRVKKHLKKLGLVEIAIYKAEGNPTTHWTLNIQKFTELYNEVLQKKISKYPNGEKPNTPMRKKENPQSGNSINKHIKQASSTSSLEHICPEGENAPLSRDEMGNDIFHPTIRGKAKEQYNGLTPEQRASFNLLMNVPPVNDEDQRFNPVVAMNIVAFKSLTEIRKAIRVYQQRIARGERPRAMGAYLKDIIEKAYEPAPPHAQDNKRFWEDNKIRFPTGSYIEHRDYIEFPRIDKELSWIMSTDIFSDQLNRILNTLRDS